MRMTKWRAIALVTLALCGYILFIGIPQQALHGERSPLTTNPTDVGLFYDDFVIVSGDRALELHGWWIPADQPRAIMVFIHGGGSNRHSAYFDSLNFYRAMVDRGVAIVAIDLRNHGKSGGDQRGIQFGRTEKNDALAAIEWAHLKAPHLPVYAMGISMGGATVIHAATQQPQLHGLILLDALLDTTDTFKQGAWAQTGLPPALFTLSAWSARTFYGLPSGDEEALELAANLALPMLVLQDPDDPVTRAPFSAELARRNRRVTHWLAPHIDPDHPDLAWKQRWGSHVSAFTFYPQETLEQIMAFIENTSAGSR